jgi:hypothetical protein
MSSNLVPTAIWGVGEGTFGTKLQSRMIIF